jgi:hypothetical protein
VGIYNIAKKHICKRIAFSGDYCLAVFEAVFEA